jgi:hypothetical protein
MNFEDWYRNNVMPGTVGYDIAEKSWNACKKEILDILNNNKELDENRMSYYNGNIRQEIENL